MTAMSDYEEERYLHDRLDGTVYLGLALGTEFTDASYDSEASGAGYARVELVGAFTIADEGGGTWRGRNTNKISCPAATANYANPAVGWGLFDAPIGGNMIFKGAMSSTLVTVGKALTIGAGELAVEPR